MAVTVIGRTLRRDDLSEDKQRNRDADAQDQREDYVSFFFSHCANPILNFTASPPSSTTGGCWIIAPASRGCQRPDTL